MNCLTAWIVPSVHELWLRHMAVNFIQSCFALLGNFHMGRTSSHFVHCVTSSNCIFDALIAIQFMEQSENSWQLCCQIMQTKFAIHSSLLFYILHTDVQCTPLHKLIFRFICIPFCLCCYQHVLLKYLRHYSRKAPADTFDTPSPRHPTLGLAL